MALELMRGDVDVLLEGGAAQTKLESFRFGSRAALEVFLRPVLADRENVDRLRRALYAWQLEVSRLSNFELLEHVVNLATNGRLSLRYLGRPVLISKRKREQPPAPQISSNAPAKPLPQTKPAPLISAVDVVAQAAALKRASDAGKPFCEVCEQQRAEAQPAVTPPKGPSDAADAPKEDAPREAQPKTQEEAGYPPVDDEAYAAAQTAAAALGNPPPDGVSKQQVRAVGVIVYEDGSKEVAFSGNASKAADYVTENGGLDDSMSLAPTDAWDSGKPGFVDTFDSSGQPYAGKSHTCAEPRLAAAGASSGKKVKSMAVVWRGKGPNPYADSRKPGLMKPCPSCAGNGNAGAGFFSGVKQ